jgi:hypothetical protein
MTDKATESEDRFEVLRRRVDELELKAAETKKPWYRNPATALSGLALVLSLTTTIYTNLEGNQETIRSKKEELRKVVISLIELRESYVKAPLSPLNPQNQLLGAKQQVYLESADRLIVQIPTQVSSSEYTIIANEHMSIGDFTKGEFYFVRAAGAAPSPALKSQALRILALGFFQAGPTRNVDKGRQRIAEELDALNADSSPVATHLKAMTYEMWAIMEALNGFQVDSKQKLDRAKKYYSDLPAEYPFRDELVGGLEERVRRGMEPPKPQAAG